MHTHNYSSLTHRPHGFHCLLLCCNVEELKWREIYFARCFLNTTHNISVVDLLIKQELPLQQRPLYQCFWNCGWDPPMGLKLISGVMKSFWNMNFASILKLLAGMLPCGMKPSSYPQIKMPHFLFFFLYLAWCVDHAWTQFQPFVQPGNP